MTHLNKPTRKDPPLAYVPMDHVMAPPLAHTATRWQPPSALRRASLAAVSAGGTIGVLILAPYVLVAIPALLAFWWLICRLYAR